MTGSPVRGTHIMLEKILTIYHSFKHKGRLAYHFKYGSHSWKWIDSNRGDNVRLEGVCGGCGRAGAKSWSAEWGCRYSGMLPCVFSFLKGRLQPFKFERTVAQSHTHHTYKIYARINVHLRTSLHASLFLWTQICHILLLLCTLTYQTTPPQVKWSWRRMCMYGCMIHLLQCCSFRA